MYILFVIVHILFAATWIGLAPIMMILNGARKRAMGTLGELYLMKAQITAGRVMGGMSGIGILISGGIITGIAGYGWFDFSHYGWLAIKQVVLVILLILTFAMMVPASKKIDRKIGEEMGGASPAHGASDELRALMNQTMAKAFIMQALILLNIILGEWKPNL